MIKLIIGIILLSIEILMGIAILGLLWWFIRYMIIPGLFPKHFCRICGRWQTVEIRQMKARNQTPFCDRDCWEQAPPPVDGPGIQEAFTSP